MVGCMGKIVFCRSVYMYLCVCIWVQSGNFHTGEKENWKMWNGNIHSFPKNLLFHISVKSFF